MLKEKVLSTISFMDRRTSNHSISRIRFTEHYIIADCNAGDFAYRVAPETISKIMEDNGIETYNYGYFCESLKKLYSIDIYTECDCFYRDKFNCFITLDEEKIFKLRWSPF